jgi:hypothetical protein
LDLKMAKVAIITYHHVHNYGAALQAWALQLAIEQLGHDPYIVDYRPSHLISGGVFLPPFDTWRIRANLVICYLKLKYVKSLFFNNDAVAKKFYNFHRDRLNISGVRYTNLKSLKENPPKADAYVCGSDQIWNASEQFGIDPAYFLTFAPLGAPRFSYATSFGRPYIHDRFKQETLELIKNLSFVSVREESAIELVKNVCASEPQWVPDPTLLMGRALANHEAIAVPEVSKDYIFSYALRATDTIAEVERHLGVELSLPIVSPEHLRRQMGASPGPLEWLGYIKGASFVVTNSYHGLLFSIIFSRPFLFVGLGGRKSAFNERALSLLNRIGLLGRVIYSSDSSEINSAVASSIPWDAIDADLDEWREKAIDYLQSSIMSAKEM